MKFCSKCGNELKENAKFCNKCGNKIETKELVEKKEEVKSSAPNNNTKQQTSNVVTKQKTNTFALIGFILSIVSVCCCGCFSAFGLIFSIIGLTQINKTNEGGKGLAIAGIVMSSIGIVLAFIVGFISGFASIFDESSYYTIMMKNMF